MRRKAGHRWPVTPHYLSIVSYTPKIPASEAAA